MGGLILGEDTLSYRLGQLETQVTKLNGKMDNLGETLNELAVSLGGLSTVMQTCPNYRAKVDTNETTLALVDQSLKMVTGRVGKIEDRLGQIIIALVLSVLTAVLNLVFK